MNVPTSVLMLLCGAALAAEPVPVCADEDSAPPRGLEVTQAADAIHPICNGPLALTSAQSCHKCHHDFESGAGGVRLNLNTLTYDNMLGVDWCEPGEALRAQLDLDESGGLLVNSVADVSVAADAGLKQHDLVLKLADQPVTSREQFQELISQHAGKAVRLTVLRRGKPVNLSFFVPRSDFNNWRLSQQRQPETLEQRYRIGVTLAEADETLRSQLKLAAVEGLVVTEVVAGGPAETAGIRQHDVLVKLDNKRLTTVEKINALVQEIQDRQVPVELIRGGQVLSLTVQPRLSSEWASNAWRFVELDVAPWKMLPPVRPNAAHVAFPYVRGGRLFWVPHSEPTDLAGQVVDLDSAYLLTDGSLLHSVHVQPNLNRLRLQWVQPSEPTDLAGQIARLKAQLAEMQSTVQALERQLHSQTPPQPPQNVPDEE